MTRSRDGQREGQSWFRIQAQSDGPVMIHLYDEIGYFGVTAQDFIRELAGVDGPVEIHINSPGGDVGDGYAIYNSLMSRPGVTTVVDGTADSAASVVMMAGEQRLMALTSSMTIHDAWTSFAGNAADMQSMVKRLETASALIAEVYAVTAGGTADFWRGLMREQTTFSPKQALDAGLITGITTNGRRPAGVPAAASARAGAIQNAAAGPQGASVDNSPWDAAKAWANGAASDDPAAFYGGICAGRKAGDPKTQEAHALPYKYTPSSAPNAAGVRNALSRLPQTQGLTNAAEAKALLERLMKQVNPDYEPGEGAPDTESGPGEQNRAARASANTEGNTMAGENGALTIEGRRTRITDISGRLTEIAGTYPAAVLPPDVQGEWDHLVAERRDHQAALSAVEARNAVLAEDPQALAAAGDRPVGADGHPPQNGPSRPQAPAVHIHGDIYDLGAIRQQARSAEDLPQLYREHAMRAIEGHRFPGSRREDAQENVSRLLDTVPDDPAGILAQRILRTGSPGYLRAFGRALAAGNPGALGGHDASILALGESDTGSYAVPFQLDPTVLLTSDGTVNPLRQISRVQQIVGKEYDLVTSAGVTVSRKAEFAAATDNAPTLAQPTVKAERVDGFIPFSVEIEGDWTGLQASMMELLRDAKDIEEATAFTLGTGVAPDASGVVSTLAAGSNVNGTGGAATLGIDDPETLESAMAPRFRNGASYMASKTTFNAYRKLFGAQAGYATDPWNRPSQGTPRELWGYGAYEASDMVSTHATGDKPLIMGDFRRGFLIVDRVGMNMELVPHLFGAAQGQYPTGRRGYFAWWRNNSVILIANAFRLLVVQ